VITRLWAGAWLAAALAMCPCAAAPQTWPGRPVTIMVPFPAGGTADLLARETAQALNQAFGSQFIVENRSGAGGNVAAAAIAKSAADGNNILFASQAQAALNKFMFKDAPYDPLRDLVPAVLVVKSPLALIANLDARIMSFRAMVDAAKAEPGKLTIGHPGIGSMGHIALELVQQKTAIKVTGVPYRGGAPMVTDLIGGHLPLVVDLLSNFVRLAKESKVRVLAVTSNNRVTALPESPTVREEIGAPFEATAWFAIMAPAGTPSEVIQKINTVTNRYLRSAAGRDLIVKQAMEVAGGTPADAAAFIREEVERWEPVIAAAKISLN